MLVLRQAGGSNRMTQSSEAPIITGQRQKPPFPIVLNNPPRHCTFERGRAGAISITDKSERLSRTIIAGHCGQSSLGPRAERTSLKAGHRTTWASVMGHLLRYVFKNSRSHSRRQSDKTHMRRPCHGGTKFSFQIQHRKEQPKSSAMKTAQRHLIRVMAKRSPCKRLCR